MSDPSETLINSEESIYSDLISEIDLVVEPDEKIQSSQSENPLNNSSDPDSEPATHKSELPTEAASSASDDPPPDDAVDQFLTEAKNAYENEMLISELEDGIDFKNDEEEFENSKKILLFECEEVIEEVNRGEEDEAEIVAEETKFTADEPEVVIEAEIAIQDEAEICEEDAEVVAEEHEAMEISLEEDEVEIELDKQQEKEDDTSLNRMHVMEDVEEGSDVSGALPSSPGHAEQRPDPPKNNLKDPTPEATEKETSSSPESEKPPIQNGINISSESTHHEVTIEEVKDDIMLMEVEENENKVEKRDIKNSDELIKEEVIEENVKETVETENDSEFLIEEPEQQETIEPEAVTANITKDLQIEENTTKEDASPKEQGSPKQPEDEEISSSDNSRDSSTTTNKRKSADEEGNIASPAKKLRSQIQQQYAHHDRILSEYIDASNCNNIEDVQLQTDQLLVEIRTLNELAKEKEKEWNNILHVKKIKEELLLRLQRKKQIIVLDKSDLDWDSSTDFDDRLTSKESSNLKGNSLMIPVVSSSPSMSSRNSVRDSKSTNNKTRNSLPKTSSILDINGQGECKQGRQGPILDVRSIIADYRQRHPETVPRRGRRLKSVLNTNIDGGKGGNIMSMASLALGSGSQVRHGSPHDVSDNLGLFLSTMESMRQDNLHNSIPEHSQLYGHSDNAMSFKEVLVQFARLSQSERQELQAQAANLTAVPKPPPPYPEVTLHPVPPVPVAAVAPTTQTQQNSLLHGILTKTQPKVENKPATFSPTLARLLTAPERVSTANAQAMYTAALNSGVSISDLLSTGTVKSRNEITITPVNHHIVGANIKHKRGDRDEDEAEDSADRLVIDESNEMVNDRSRGNGNDNGSETGDEVPQCQGCHLKSALFVCAGCGNQWYCSRDCQVAAWDEHSEVCSG